MLDGAAPWGLNHYGKSDFLRRLDDGAIDILVEAAGRLQGPLSQIMVGHMGGAIADVGPDTTAFSNRGAEFFYHSVLFWDDPAQEEAQISFARGLWSEMRPYSSGAYVNFLDVDEADRLHDAYAPGTYEQLVALKREYDPENVLRLNQNIPPS
jgi:hypothetical protein